MSNKTEIPELPEISDIKIDLGLQLGRTAEILADAGSYKPPGNPAAGPTHELIYPPTKDDGPVVFKGKVVKLSSNQETRGYFTESSATADVVVLHGASAVTKNGQSRDFDGPVTIRLDQVNTVQPADDLGKNQPRLK